LRCDAGRLPGILRLVASGDAVRCHAGFMHKQQSGFRSLGFANNDTVQKSGYDEVNL